MNDAQRSVELSNVRRQVPPSAPKMTACEVLTWIAFGKALPKERLGESEREDLLALASVAADKDACAIELVESDMEVRETWAAWKALEQAQRELLEALRAKKLQASGCNHRGEHVDRIPVAVFKDPRNQVTWWDTVESDLTVESDYKRGPTTPFANVAFETAAVLSVWQPTADEDDGVRLPPESAQASPSPDQNGAEVPLPAEPATTERDTATVNGATTGARKRGMQPVTLSKTIERMMADYAELGPDALDNEKQTSLVNKYSVGVGTVRKARDVAVARLRSSDKP